MLDISAPFTDPFSETQATLELILRESIDLSAFVDTGDQVDDGQPKTITAPSDYGEWRVLPALGGGVLPRVSSNGTTIIQNFEIGLDTDNEDVKMALFPMKFLVIRALLKATREDDTFGLPYILKWAFQDIREDANDSQYRRGVPGWTSVIVISISMQFSTSDLEA